MTPEDIIQFVATFIALLIVMPLHEFAHAFAAVKCGDDTPKHSGRYTLNPLAHFDLIGLVMLLFAHFGWAKPVPINPYNFRNLKWGYFWTSIAGVLANLATAFLIYPIFVLVVSLFYKYSVDILLFDDLIINTLMLIYYISINLFAFNLIPIYPLDGFRLLEVADKKKGKVFCFLRDKGQMILLVLIVISMLADRFTILAYIDVLGFYMSFMSGIISYPITAFWSLFF